MDPGSVRTSIWRSWYLMEKATEFLWAPPSVGARPLVAAATADLRSIPQAPHTLLPRPWAQPQHGQQGKDQLLQNGSTAASGKSGAVNHEEEHQDGMADKRAPSRERQGVQTGRANGRQVAVADVGELRVSGSEH